MSKYLGKGVLQAGMQVLQELRDDVSRGVRLHCRSCKPRSNLGYVISVTKIKL